MTKHLSKLWVVLLIAFFCCALWGSAFRPSYQRIDEFVASLPNRPVMGAFTATATAAVASDIEKLLGLQENQK